jgi:phosphatidylserine/phosphatidylglycerophosphate/cardiolipin synthase-like enzyme
VKRKKNVDVKIYTNRFTAPDEIVNTPQNHFVKKHDKGTQQIHAISKLGVLADTWALTPKGADFMIHAKAFSVDGTSALISSFNIDPRSYHTNLESGVLVKNCPAFAKRVQQASERTGLAWQEDQKDCVECNHINRQPWKTRAFQWLIFDLL